MKRDIWVDDIQACDYLHATHAVLRDHAASSREVSTTYIHCKLAEYFTHDDDVRDLARVLAGEFAARLPSNLRQHYEHKAQTLTDVLDKAFAKDPKEVTVVVQVPQSYEVN